MNIEYVLNHCDECNTENKYNWLITVNKGYSITICEECMETLVEKIADKCVED